MGTINRQIIVNKFSTPEEGVSVREQDYKDPKPNELIIKTGYCPINPADLNVIEGKYGRLPELPAVIGNEGSGQVIAVGKECGHFKEGDHVLYMNRQDCWQEFVAATPDQIIKLPNSLPFKLSAMLKVNPATAWLLLNQGIKMESHDWVVQNASNSGVGVAIIQLAKSFGIKTMNFVRREDCKDKLLSLGADAVFTDDESGKIEATQFIKNENIVLPLAINAVGGESALRIMSLLSEGGTHITYGAMSKRPLKIPNSFLIFKNLTIRGLWLSHWLKNEDKSNIEEVYQDLAKKMLDEKLDQPIDSVYGLEELEEAVKRSMQEGRNGKVLLKFQS